MTASALLGLGYFIRTFGCQMNLHDSERVSGLLDSLGAFEVASPDAADIVVFMTCCVREAADTRLYGQCNSCKSLPPAPSGVRTIAVGGCIAQRDGEGLLTNVDNVDVIFGTHSIAHVGELIANSRATHHREVRCEEHERLDATSMPWRRATSYHAWVPIMTGCNNFCSFCIVPYVRGREKSRAMEEILTEVDVLCRQGVRAITLLGQNVNSYGRDLFGEPRFAELLRRVAESGVERIAFTSSHPKDLLPETIDAMAELPAVMPHLHLALQSGSSRVLKLMNRHYTREDYTALALSLREKIPDIALTTDIIVGFPGEEEADFDQTLSLARELRFAQAFTFIYSKREGTPAAKIEDTTPREVILARFKRLTSVIEESAYEFNHAYLGRTLSVLIEGTSRKDAQMLTGKSPWNQTVHCPCPPHVLPEDAIGRIVDVKVDCARTWYLSGQVQGAPR